MKVSTRPFPPLLLWLFFLASPLLAVEIAVLPVKNEGVITATRWVDKSTGRTLFEADNVFPIQSHRQGTPPAPADYLWWILKNPHSGNLKWVVVKNTNASDSSAWRESPERIFHEMRVEQKAGSLRLSGRQNFDGALLGAAAATTITTHFSLHPNSPDPTEELEFETTRDPKKLVNQALFLHEKGDSPSAIAKLQSLASSPERDYFLALFLIRAGSPEPARSLLTRTMKGHHPLAAPAESLFRATFGGNKG